MKKQISEIVAEETAPPIVEVKPSSEEKITLLESKLAQMESNQQLILDFINKLQEKIKEQEAQPTNQPPQQPMDNTANTLDLLRGFLQPKNESSDSITNQLALESLRSGIEMNKSITQWFVKKVLKDVD